MQVTFPGNPTYVILSVDFFIYRKSDDLRAVDLFGSKRQNFTPRLKDIVLFLPLCSSYN
jgi:hypothetical protein